MVTWTTPVALWLLAVVPLVWIALLVARTTFNVHQRRRQAARRPLPPGGPRPARAPGARLLALRARALARPVLSRSSPRHSIVYLVDVSHSISSRAIEEAARKI